MRFFFLFSLFTLVVISAATQTGLAQFQFATPEQQKCLRQLMETMDHRALIQGGVKIKNIAFDNFGDGAVYVTVIYDDLESLITRTCL